MFNSLFFGTPHLDDKSVNHGKDSFFFGPLVQNFEIYNDTPNISFDFSHANISIKTVIKKLKSKGEYYE